ncbi:MAG: RNA polymerase factor sigma-54 [Luteolibacter sp.]|jgi:RNA polymerase sigma-54 factor
MSDAYLSQSISQQQTLAPHMRKSLEILQVGTQELAHLIRQSLESNPVLEDVSDFESTDTETADDSLDSLNETDDDWRERSIMESRGNSWTQDDEERRQRMFETLVAPVTLQSHLQKQIDESMVGPDVREAAEVILGNLDARGFLDQSPEMIARQSGCEIDAVRRGLDLIRSFEPAGVGASSLPEALLLQLERDEEGTGSVEYRIVRDHLEELARKRHPQIARAMGITVDRVAQAAERIGRLNPNPGGDFDSTANPHIAPDVVIERDEDGNLTASLTGEHLPQLRINDFYKDMIGKDGVDAKARQFLREQIREGRGLMRALALRQETILAIAHKIIEHQPMFFKKGPRHLRPMTMHDIAAELDLHPTTVSRAVAGKYVLTPRGLMEMRAFFATGYQTEGGDQVSNAGVREAIQQLVARENPAKPLSDEAIMKALAAQGITVARRTVAKYREQLNILPSHLRKSY